MNEPWSALLGRPLVRHFCEIPRGFWPRRRAIPILNALATDVAKALRSEAHRGEPKPSGTHIHDAIREMQRHLADTQTAFFAQCRRRNDLVSAIERRLSFKNDLEYEKFFFRYYPQLTEAEKFEFDQVRAMTDGPLQVGNRKILEILETHPAILDISPKMTALRQHLVFWLNKYDKVFSLNRAMCLLYIGVEDGVPFPSGLDDFVNTWLLDHRSASI